jgi:hypothetical protein
MKVPIGVNRTGLVLAATLAAYHLGWAVLVASGFAQAQLDFVFWVHFIKPVYVIEPFRLMRAVLLIIVTGSLGYAFGAVFALIWNAFHRRAVTTIGAI